MLRQNLSFYIFVSCVLPLQLVYADQTFNMDEITQSLQAEYQHHLKPKKKVVKARPKRHSKPKVNRVALKIPRVLQQKRQQVVAPTRRKPASRPTQHARKAPASPAPKAEDLFAAASYGNVAMIGRLLQQGVNVNSANSERETALHMAAARGKYSAVIYLVNHGANIHARTIKNWQAIHHATRFRHANIANYLKQRGASPYAKTSDGLSAIDMARASGDRRLMGVFGVR